MGELKLLQPVASWSLLERLFPVYFKLSNQEREIGGLCAAAKKELSPSKRQIGGLERKRDFTPRQVVVFTWIVCVCSLGESARGYLLETLGQLASSRALELALRLLSEASRFHRDCFELLIILPHERRP